VVDAVVFGGEYDIEGVTSFAGKNWGDPWDILVRDGDVAAWEAAGLDFYFHIRDIVAGPAGFDYSWVDRLGNYELRQADSLTGTMTEIASPSGSFGDQPVSRVDTAAGTPGDNKLILYPVGGGGGTPSQWAPQTGPFLIGMQAKWSTGNIHMAGDHDSTNKLAWTSVGNELRSGWGSGDGTPTFFHTPAETITSVPMVRCLARDATNHARHEWFVGGDYLTDWQEETSTDVIATAAAAPYSIDRTLAFLDYRLAHATYNADCDLLRIFGWNVDPTGTAAYESFRKHLAWSGAMR
jgi:hypothetical protein